MKNLRVDAKDPTPLWSQIEEGMRRLVGSGGLGAGQPVPSVRDLAKEFRINPATVSKAYQRLSEAGLFEVRRGEGTFVAASPPPMGKPERSRILREAATRYAAVAASLGASREEAADSLRSAWTEPRREKGEER